jgi:RNA polymerase sigma-70 factor (ECF subfamily)
VAEEPVEAVGDPGDPVAEGSAEFAEAAEPAQLEPDVRLMLAFRSGDAAAFDALFHRWSGPLLRYLERMLRDSGSAEELVQEVFLRVHGARERYAPEARFSTWLYRIATNLARNELRRPRHRSPHRSRDEEGGPILVSDQAHPETVVDARRRAARVERELDLLPEKQRAALCLTAVEGLTYAEVAEALEVSEQAVKALVHRGRSALALRLRDGAGRSGEE